MSIINICEVVKIKSSHSSQGDFVEINKEDFDASKHELYEGTVTVVIPAGNVTIAGNLTSEGNISLGKGVWGNNT